MTQFNREKFEDLFTGKYKPSIKERIIDFFDDIRTYFINIKCGLINLWTYKNVIWSQRDWDGGYFPWVLMKFKLEKMLEYFEDEDRGFVSINNDEIVSKLKETINSLDLYLNFEDEDYELELEVKNVNLKNAMLLLNNYSQEWWD